MKKILKVLLFVTFLTLNLNSFTSVHASSIDNTTQIINYQNTYSDLPDLPSEH